MAIINPTTRRPEPSCARCGKRPGTHRHPERPGRTDRFCAECLKRLLRLFSRMDP